MLVSALADLRPSDLRLLMADALPSSRLLPCRGVGPWVTLFSLTGNRVRPRSGLSGRVEARNLRCGSSLKGARVLDALSLNPNPRKKRIHEVDYRHSRGYHWAQPVR